jgi:alpha-L-glutamate ligase-like protein
MIAEAIRQLKNAGVLSMNRRNAEYIMHYNPRSRFPLVDDKVLTKELAQKYAIPTPELYGIIEHHGSIAGLYETLREHRQFVIKPARGSGGSGIILIVDHREDAFVTQSGKKIPQEVLAYHISSILSGIYSLEGLEDKAIVESLIHPEPVFAAVTFEGVPDIRIIVCMGVPVMAMVRLPTRASDGKANLHRGAIGAGIDIRHGTTLTAVHKSQVVTHHPDTGNPVSGIAIPHWKEMLEVAARSYEMTGLGYVGVDLVIDRQRGPLLLELNARPGLAIQMANRSGLHGRLKRIEKAPSEIFVTPETRIAWAREAFCAL